MHIPHNKIHCYCFEQTAYQLRIRNRSFILPSRFPFPVFFLSVWRAEIMTTLFSFFPKKLFFKNISYKLGLLATNSLNIYLIKNFVSPIFLKCNFSEYKILTFFVSTLYISPQSTSLHG